MENMNFNELPMEIQSEVKSTLRAYDNVNVIFENGRYNTSTGACLKSHYASDHKVIGRYFAKDIYTNEERIINYIEQFLSYPIEYKGKKDWAMIQQLELLRKNHKQAKFKLVDGNLMVDRIEKLEW